MYEILEVSKLSDTTLEDVAAVAGLRAEFVEYTENDPSGMSQEFTGWYIFGGETGEEMFCRAGCAMIEDMIAPLPDRRAALEEAFLIATV